MGGGRGGRLGAELGAGALVLALSGCVFSSMDQEPGKPGSPVNVAAFQPRLLEIAAGYEAYGRVDDELRWAPELCRQPMPSRPRTSQSGDLDTHGKKLYFLFAADRKGYLGRGPQPASAVGQVVVKEAWTVEEVPPDTKYDESKSPVMYLREGGHLFHAAKKSGLFIMYRLDPATAGSDNGWVYGTVTPDGAAVTSAGRVESCMGCHTTAPERLFGIAYSGA